MGAILKRLKVQPADATKTRKTLQRLNHILGVYTTDPQRLLQRIEEAFNQTELERYVETTKQFDLRTFISEHLNEEQRATLEIKDDDKFVEHVHQQNFPEHAKHRKAEKRFLNSLNPRLPSLHLTSSNTAPKLLRPLPIACASHQQQAAASFPAELWDIIHSAPFHLFPPQRSSTWVLPIILASSIQLKANEQVDNLTGLRSHRS